MSEDFAEDDFMQRVSERRAAGHYVAIDLVGQSHERLTLRNFP